MTNLYHCPNCGVALLPTAQSCNACGASFGEGSAWKPLAEGEAKSPPSTAANLAFAAIGISMLVASFLPIGARLLHATADGMYGPIFKPHSPALFILLSYIANYLPLAALAWFLLRHFKVMDRVPYKYRGTKLFGFGVALILLYSVARVLAATVEGGGAGFAVASLSPFILVPALALLVIAVVRLCVGYGKGEASQETPDS